LSKGFWSDGGCGRLGLVGGVFFWFGI
jgi:hypothetical protein